MAIVQGYTAVLVKQRNPLGEVPAGSHEWQAGDNAFSALWKGGLKGTWENFKNRFSWWTSHHQQEIIFIRMQPIAGNKFGTQNAVEYLSERYQQLNIRFYIVWCKNKADPVPT